MYLIHIICMHCILNKYSMHCIHCSDIIHCIICFVFYAFILFMKLVTDKLTDQPTDIVRYIVAAKKSPKKSQCRSPNMWIYRLIVNIMVIYRVVLKSQWQVTVKLLVKATFWQQSRQFGLWLSRLGQFTFSATLILKGAPTVATKNPQICTKDPHLSDPYIMVLNIKRIIVRIFTLFDKIVTIRIFSEAHNSLHYCKIDMLHSPVFSCWYGPLQLSTSRWPETDNSWLELQGWFLTTGSLSFPL